MSNIKKDYFSPFWKQCFVTAAICTDVIGHGCTIGYPAVLLPQVKVSPSIQITEEQSSWVASVLGIAMLIGIFLTPPAMGRLGRKAAHYIVIVSLLLAWSIFYFATSFTHLLFGRILQGVAFGMYTPLRSVLIGEYTSPKHRGAFLATISLAQGTGIMLSHLIGSLLNWQITALTCSSFSFISLIMTIYTPETPSWLADKRRFEECREVFRWLRGHDEDKELDAMIQARLKERELSSGYNLRNTYKAIKKKEFYKPTFIMCSMYLLLAFSGATSIGAYATTILPIILGPEANSDIWMVALDTQRIFTSSLAIVIISRCKRRTVTLVTLGINILTHIAIAGYVYAKHNNYLTYDAIWIPGMLVLSHYLTMAFGMVPLPAIIAGEVFPLAYRSVGGSISTAFYSLFFFLSLKTFSTLIDSLGLHGTYLVYAALLSYCFISLWWALPETKDRTLQEIEDEYRGISQKGNDVEIVPLKSQK